MSRVGESSIEFISVDSRSNRHRKFLFSLLREREPHHNISHMWMPSFEDHVNFMKRHPYREWWIMELISGEMVGSVYVTDRYEIGIFILDGHRGNGYGKMAIDEAMRCVNNRWVFANINPNNHKSIDFFKSLGFEHIQNTYRKEVVG